MMIKWDFPSLWYIIKTILSNIWKKKKVILMIDVVFQIWFRYPMYETIVFLKLKLLLKRTCTNYKFECGIHCCEDNCYSNQNNNPQYEPDGWTTLVSPSNLLQSIKCITFIYASHHKYILIPLFHHL